MYVFLCVCVPVRLWMCMCICMCVCVMIRWKTDEGRTSDDADQTHGPQSCCLRPFSCPPRASKGPRGFSKGISPRGRSAQVGQLRRRSSAPPPSPKRRARNHHAGRRRAGNERAQSNAKEAFGKAEGELLHARGGPSQPRSAQQHRAASHRNEVQGRPHAACGGCLQFDREKRAGRGHAK